MKLEVIQLCFNRLSFFTDTANETTWNRIEDQVIGVCSQQTHDAGFRDLNSHLSFIP